MKTYEEACNFIQEAAKYGSVLGLENMRALMNALGNPQNDVRVIHIAGTNGKGSVGAYLASILKEAGLVVGRYCSPAVFDPLECWQYDGRTITKEEYVDALSQVKTACDIVALYPEKEIHPTVFEIETALAFVYAKQMQVDVLLLETGLGGETDATNVVEHPLACVFTTISRDHMQFLGETLSEIASVKAGIIKKGAYVFSAVQESEVEKVLTDRFATINGMKGEEKLRFVEEEHLCFLEQVPGELKFSYKGKTYTTTMSGMYQMRNAALAIEVCEVILQKLTELSYLDSQKLQKSYFQNISNSVMITHGIAKAVWAGRFEVIGQEPLFIIDGAHNEDAVKQLAHTVKTSFGENKLHFIIGILADKEHEKMLELMIPYAKRIFTVTPPNPRGLDGKVLAKEVQNWHTDVIFCDTIETAIEKALAQSEADGCPILAFGSLSYLGKLKEHYKQICESRMRDV